MKSKNKLNADDVCCYYSIALWKLVVGLQWPQLFWRMMNLLARVILNWRVCFKAVYNTCYFLENLINTIYCVLLPPVNYDILLERGTCYAYMALINWDLRNRKLMCEWLMINELEEPERNLRYEQLITNQHKRFCGLSKLFLSHLDDIKKSETDYNNTTITLECINKECRISSSSAGIVVKLKNYNPGFHKCTCCKKNLEPQGATENINSLLNELGIQLVN